jgi:hypothetical protein
MKTILLFLTSAFVGSTTAFLIPLQQRPPPREAFRSKPTAVAVGPLFALPPVESMRISEIRQELESYGIQTASFLEKKEMVEALAKARSEGKKPTQEGTPATKANGDMSRDDRIKEEMEKASRMKVSDLKKELENRGVSTKSFFEKPEFVKAYAEAVVDGVASNSSGRAGRSGAAVNEEKFDPAYRDVVMQKFDRRDPRLAQSKVIDVRLAT